MLDSLPFLPSSLRYVRARSLVGLSSESRFPFLSYPLSQPASQPAKFRYLHLLILHLIHYNNFASLTTTLHSLSLHVVVVVVVAVAVAMQPAFSTNGTEALALVRREMIQYQSSFLLLL